MISVDEVRAIALGLPSAEERASYDDRPSWRTKPRMFACVRDDPTALVVWVASVAERDALVAERPEVFLTTDHYRDHAIVLVDLDAVSATEAAELVTESYRLRAGKRDVTELDRRTDGTVGSPR